MTTPSPDPADEAEGRRYETLGDELRATVEEARSAASAEISYQMARLQLAGSYLGRILGLGLLAVALVFFALMALVVGLVLALTPLLGPWGAMLAVIAALALSILVTFRVIRAGWRRLIRLLGGSGN
jgi:uncharacterized membrane protein YqjE